jgi:hypothetical protein
MSARPLSAEAQRLLTAFDLFEAGVDMMRHRLFREHPDASPEKIEELLGAWLMHRPGAELGDAPGRPATWPRTKPTE